MTATIPPSMQRPTATEAVERDVLMYRAYIAQVRTRLRVFNIVKLCCVCTKVFCVVIRSFCVDLGKAMYHMHVCADKGALVLVVMKDV